MSNNGKYELLRLYSDLCLDGDWIVDNLDNPNIDGKRMAVAIDNLVYLCGQLYNSEDVQDLYREYNGGR